MYLGRFFLELELFLCLLRRLFRAWEGVFVSCMGELFCAANISSRLDFFLLLLFVVFVGVVVGVVTVVVGLWLDLLLLLCVVFVGVVVGMVTVVVGLLHKALQ